MRGSLPQLRVRYEDEHLVVVDKPSGLLSVSTGARGETTAHSILRAKYGQIFIVHRLDRDTSGVMVFARDEETKRLLQENWDESVVERKYTAVVEGIPEEQEGTVTSWLRDNPRSMVVSSCPYDNGGQKAVTHWKVLGTARGIREGRWQINCSLMEFELETGRKNQIRVHAAVMGHPVAGDRKYGARTNPAGRLALHAHTLKFRDPHTGKIMSFSSPVPAEFKRIFRTSGR